MQVFSIENEKTRQFGCDLIMDCSSVGYKFLGNITYQSSDIIYQNLGISIGDLKASPLIDFSE